MSRQFSADDYDFIRREHEKLYGQAKHYSKPQPEEEEKAWARGEALLDCEGRQLGSEKWVNWAQQVGCKSLDGIGCLTPSSGACIRYQRCLTA